MHYSLLLVVTTVIASIFAQPVPQSAESQEDFDFRELAKLAKQAQDMVQLELESAEKLRRRNDGPCTLKKLRIRKEWGYLTDEERIAYTDATLCLQKRPALTPSELVPGAKNRLDDFVATHINQTLSIHFTANFLSWHRYFIFQYEEALRNECGYTGAQPYWDWAKTAKTGVFNSPIFDGSATSMSGDGAPIDDDRDIVLGGTGGIPPFYVQPANGGGCVMSGPFKDMSVNLGPVQLPVPGGATIENLEDPFAYNPRCLSRDLTDYINKRHANATSIIKNILQPQDVNAFQTQMQGIPGTPELGIHGGGHFTIGGDPGRDTWVSPGDPMFYLHHAQIDRVWWIWQQLDQKTRQEGESAIAGTITFLNEPPSRDGTIEDYIDFGYAAGPSTKIKDLLSVADGPLCYVYL